MDVMNNLYYSDYALGLAGAAAGAGIAALLLWIALVVCAIVAYFMAISSLVKTARAKGCPFGSGKLWFIGIFTTPIVLGILVAAQPDRGQKADQSQQLPPM